MLQISAPATAMVLVQATWGGYDDHGPGYDMDSYWAGYYAAQGKGARVPVKGDGYIKGAGGDYGKGAGADYGKGARGDYGKGAGADYGKGGRGDYGKGARGDYGKGAVGDYGKGAGGGYGTGARVPIKGAGKGSVIKGDGKGGKGMWVMMPAPARNASKGQGAKNGGSSRAQQGGGNKKRKKDSNDSVKPIDAEMLQQMHNLLDENDGEIDLGSMTSVFPGLRKKQVEEHFNVDEEYMVSYIGAAPLTEKRERMKQEKAEKPKKEKDPDAPPPPELESHVIDEITVYLADCGGCCFLGRVSTKFSGIKKAQLEAHFDVEHGDFDTIVHLPGHTGDPDMDAIAQVPVKKRKVGETSIVKSENGKKDKKKAKKDKDPNAPPPPDLEIDVLNEITSFLEECGGSCMLGKLSTKFSGLKKAQLVGHFEVEHGEKETTIRLLGNTGDSLS